MTWPLSQDYNEAIQSPKSNFADADLKRGEAVARRRFNNRSTPVSVPPGRPFGARARAGKPR